ncbi:MAG: hypothetical protein MW690_000447 [Methanophagales archaeon]|nr:hypothetical protein [Methanophagales archaeon]
MVVEEAVVVQQPQREESNGEERMKDAIMTALPVIGKPTKYSFFDCDFCNFCNFCNITSALSDASSAAFGSSFRNLARRSMPDAT